MPVNRIALIGLIVLGLTATITIAPAQNTSNPMLSGNTTNPILSGNTVSQPPPVPVSPALPPTLLGPPIGRNQLTGLPCSARGPLAVTAGAGTLPGTTAAPGATSPSQNGSSTTQQLPMFPSVFGSSPSC
jgi:hypothetical protein